MPEKEKKVFSTHGISNFKAFKNLEGIEIAPITLIYGQNSGGKSTFIQSLLALSQSSKSLIKLIKKTNHKYIMGDPDQLNRVFINLMKNSEESFLQKIEKNPDFKGNIDI